MRRSSWRRYRAQPLRRKLPTHEHSRTSLWRRSSSMLTTRVRCTLTRFSFPGVIRYRKCISSGAELSAATIRPRSLMSVRFCVSNRKRGKSCCPCSFSFYLSTIASSLWPSYLNSKADGSTNSGKLPQRAKPSSQTSSNCAIPSLQTVQR